MSFVARYLSVVTNSSKEVRKGRREGLETRVGLIRVKLLLVVTLEVCLSKAGRRWNGRNGPNAVRKGGPGSIESRADRRGLRRLVITARHGDIRRRAVDRAGNKEGGLGDRSSFCLGGRGRI